MSVKQLVESRRSIRKVKDEQVDEALLHELLQQAAGLCPHPERLKSTRFLLATEYEARARLTRSLTNIFASTKLGKWLPDKLWETVNKRFMEIPGHLIVITKSNASQQIQDENIAEACYMMQTLQLLAWERGIGMLWDSEDLLYVPQFLEALSLAPDEQMLGIIHYGYIAKVPRPRKRTEAAKRLTIYPSL